MGIPLLCGSGLVVRSVVGIALLSAACGCRDGKIHLNLRPDVARPPRSAVIFFPDGMDLTRFNAMVAAGELPNIQKRFVEGGVRVRAVTGLPSITYPNCTSMITGVYPGHHGIMGNFWFKRRTLETRYYMTFESYRTVNDHFTAPRSTTSCTTSSRSTSRTTPVGA